MVWVVNSTRSWRPRITRHALLRYLQRVKGLPFSDGDEKVIHQLVGDPAPLYAEMWPDSMALPADPGCAFVMKRGEFIYPVRMGILKTVVEGRHYRTPVPLAVYADFE